MLKMALINGISMGIFDFLPFFNYLGPFFALWLYFGSNSNVFNIHIKAYLRFTMTLDRIFFNISLRVGSNFFVEEKYRK